MECSSYWLLFLSATIAINITPGPDMIYILSKTIAQGRKIGLASSLGVCTGSLVHIFAAAFGLSAILATSVMAFSVVKYMGAAYLIYMGIQALRSRGISFDIPEKKQEQSTFWKAFKQGVLIDILNPKVAIFFMAFLPQFVRPELGHAPAQILILGFLVNLGGLVIESVLVLTAAQTTIFFRSNSQFSTLLDRVLGSMLIGLGIRLALTENHTN
ncbi:LysE family translocator [Desulfopila aestuarii]|uniref:Resistance to homoserine/threonine (RhtB) family protein n=1 Tax=Desulfopila aestuarii DSM 18488 TaxID=1121416 RepID=A0A1M7YLJ1_9BACT|nr:LysE family translocator [Desulfopila aestuarii]SHO53490.1 resistance to homoserine/threonine (RhtB) family protein [Desulfopila aestuarii DSM 18488]